MGQRLLAAYGNSYSPFSHRVPGFSLAQGEPELKLPCLASVTVRGDHTSKFRQQNLETLCDRLS